MKFEYEDNYWEASQGSPVRMLNEWAVLGWRAIAFIPDKIFDGYTVIFEREKKLKPNEQPSIEGESKADGGNNSGVQVESRKHV